MGDPKVLYGLRYVAYDSTIEVAEADNVLAEVDIHSITGYAGAVETDNTFTLAAIAGRILHPRNVVLTITAGTMTGGKFAVYGTGMQGTKVREEFTVTGAGTYTGNVPFVTVDRVSVWGCTGTVGNDDEISIGIGAKIGIPLGEDMELVDIVKERFNAAEIAPLGTVNRQYGTYIPVSTLDGAKALELWYTYKRTLTW
jgi:hypothetical protein